MEQYFADCHKAIEIMAISCHAIIDDMQEKTKQDSFVVNDEDELSFYDSDIVESRKRSERGDDCGDAIVTPNDVKHMQSFLVVLQEHGYKVAISHNVWWDREFGAQLEGIENGMGRAGTQNEFAKNVLRQLRAATLDGEHVYTCSSIIDAPKRRCGLCGGTKRCDYELRIGDNTVYPLGGKCYVLAQQMIHFYEAFVKEKDPETLFLVLKQTLDNILDANQSKRLKN